MTDRSFRLRVAAILAVAVVALVAAAVAGVVSLQLDAQVSDFYATFVGNDAPSTEQYEAFNRLATMSYALRGLTAPLVFAALISVFVALAVLAARWRPRPALRTG